MYSLGCTIEILPCCTGNKRRTRFSRRALHIPYRFSLVCCANRENHPFLKPSPACQIAGPPSQHPTSDFWKSSNFLVVAPQHAHKSLCTESGKGFAKHSIFIRCIFQCIWCSRGAFGSNLQRGLAGGLSLNTADATPQAGRISPTGIIGQNYPKGTKMSYCNDKP